MTKLEKRVFQWIDQHKNLLFIFAASIIGVLLRYCGRDFESDDYLHCLLPWYEQLKAGGIPAIAANSLITDYNVPYQVLIVILAHLPGSTLLKYKTVSWIADALLVVGGSLFAAMLCGGYQTQKGKNAFSLAWGCLAMWPSLFLNSAFWAQCDSIYVSLVLFALYFHFRDKPLPSFLFLGLAFAMKLQTVLIFTFFLYDYVIRKKYSIFWFLLIPAVSAFFCVIIGCGPFDFIKIYQNQAGGQPGMTKEFPNLWMLIDVGDFFKLPAVLMTMGALGTGLISCMRRPQSMENDRGRVQIMVWTIWTCLFLLPHMHDRYGYLLSVLLVIWFAVDIRALLPALLVELATLNCYQYFLFRVETIDYRLLAALMFIAGWFLLTWQVFVSPARQQVPLQEHK